MKLWKRIKRRFRSRRFRKKFFTALTVIGILLIISLILDSFVFNNKNEDSNIDIIVSLPDEIYASNEAIIDWVNSGNSAKSVYDKYRSLGRLDYTKPLEFTYAIYNLKSEEDIESQSITIYDRDSYKEVFSETLSSEERTVSVENLRSSTTYEYHIRVNLNNGDVHEKTGEFTTESTPSFLFIDGVRNVRDIGNRETVDGKRIRKYMIYRGTELDGSIEKNYCLKQNGIDYMVEVLGINTQIDLRWYDEVLNRNVLGKNVTYKNYPIVNYDSFFVTDYSIDSTRKIFSDLSKKETYPVYVHCTYGADRTGTLIYVLDALLGVDEKALYQEWELSLFCHGNCNYKPMDAFIKKFKTYKGDTMQEKAENYLLSIGVTQAEIDSIREILLTD